MPKSLSAEKTEDIFKIIVFIGSGFKESDIEAIQKKCIEISRNRKLRLEVDYIRTDSFDENRLDKIKFDQYHDKNNNVNSLALVLAHVLYSTYDKKSPTTIDEVPSKELCNKLLEWGFKSANLYSCFGGRVVKKDSQAEDFPKDLDLWIRSSAKYTNLRRYAANSIVDALDIFVNHHLALRENKDEKSQNKNNLIIHKIRLHALITDPQTVYYSTPTKNGRISGKFSMGVGKFTLKEIADIINDDILAGKIREIIEKKFGKNKTHFRLYHLKQNLKDLLSQKQWQEIKKVHQEKYTPNAIKNHIIRRVEKYCKIHDIKPKEWINNPLITQNSNLKQFRQKAFVIALGSESLTSITNKQYHGSYKPTRGRVEELKGYLESKIDLNDKDTNGRTPLIRAVAMSSKKIVKILLKRDSNINEQDNFGRTALMYSSTLSHDKTTLILLKNRNIDVNMQDKDGMTALMCAVNDGAIDNINMLLRDKRVRTDLKNKDGFTALEMAQNLLRNESKNSTKIDFERIIKLLDQNNLKNNTPTDIKAEAKKPLQDKQRVNRPQKQQNKLQYALLPLKILYTLVKYPFSCLKKTSDKCLRKTSFKTKNIKIRDSKIETKRQVLKGRNKENTNNKNSRFSFDNKGKVPGKVIRNTNSNKYKQEKVHSK